MCIGAAVGALVGGIIGAGSVALPQMIENVREGQPLMAKIDPTEVGKAAVTGAVAGGVAGATFGVGTVALGTGLGATVASGALAGATARQAGVITDNALAGRDLANNVGNAEEVAKAAVVGGVTAGVGYGVGRAISRFLRPTVPVSTSEVDSAAQSLIDDVVQNEFQNVRLTHYPQYDPDLPTNVYGMATRDISTKIGSIAIKHGRGETVITIAHEEMHHRLWARGWTQSEAYVESVAQRFARFKGW